MAIASALTLLLLTTPTTYIAQPSSPKAVSEATVLSFVQSLKSRSNTEYQDVAREAQELLPRGTVLKGFPEFLLDHVPPQRPSPIFLVRSLVEKEGYDVKDLEAVTIFKGDSGIVQVDVIVVVRRKTKAIVGVYARLWGR